MMMERTPSAACVAYQKMVFERETNMPPNGYCFTNNFDKALSFKQELFSLIPDLEAQLHVIEIDTLIDFIYDKTCEDLRQKGLLSQESKTILRR